MATGPALSSILGCMKFEGSKAKSRAACAHVFSLSLLEYLVTLGKRVAGNTLFELNNTHQ